jgi:uncharacterized protein
VVSLIIYVISSLFLLTLLVYIIQLLLNEYKKIKIAEKSYENEKKVLDHKASKIFEEISLIKQQNKFGWNGYRKFRVKNKIKETPDICSFYLIPHDGKDIPPFYPGQFLTFKFNFNPLNKPEIRCYSLSDRSGHPCYRVSIKKVVTQDNNLNVHNGLISTYFHDVLNVNDILDVKAPGGNFYLDLNTMTPIVLIAAGVGITPFLSMINSIIKANSGHEVWLFFGVRNKAHHFMKQHLEDLAHINKKFHFIVLYSRPEKTDILGEDYYEKGRIEIELIKKVLPSNNFIFYICAPPELINKTAAGLKEWGVPKEKIKFEAFGENTLKNINKKNSSVSCNDAEIKFDKSKKSFKWDSSFNSILDLAEANGIAIDSGCRAGNCGTCLVAVKKGEVELNIESSFETESGSCLACISIPNTNLILDI